MGDFAAVNNDLALAFGDVQSVDSLPVFYLKPTNQGDQGRIDACLPQQIGQCWRLVLLLVFALRLGSDTTGVVRPGGDELLEPLAGLVRRADTGVAGAVGPR